MFVPCTVVSGQLHPKLPPVSERDAPGQSAIVVRLAASWQQLRTCGNGLRLMASDGLETQAEHSIAKDCSAPAKHSFEREGGDSVHAGNLDAILDSNTLTLRLD